MTFKLSQTNVNTVPHGLYAVEWESGESGLAAIGSDKSGKRWIQCPNWCSTQCPPLENYVQEINELQPLYLQRDQWGHSETPPNRKTFTLDDDHQHPLDLDSVRQVLFTLIGDLTRHSSLPEHVRDILWERIEALPHDS